MGKVAVILSTGAGGSVAVVGGVYFSGILNTLDSNLPKTLSEFKNGSTGGCLDYVFPGLDIKKTGTAISDTDKANQNYFDSEKAKSGYGCLAVNWERQDYSDSDNPWSGNFRWLWTFARGDKGFVMFTVAEPSSTEKELTLSGVVYLVTKGENGWTVDKNKDANASKKINKSDFANVFPKVGSELKKDLESDSRVDYWGFVSGADEMEKVCKTGEGSTCKTKSKETSFRGLWIMSSLDDAFPEMKKWSENVDNWSTSLYTTPDLVLKDAVASAKGKWRVNSLKRFEGATVT